MVTFCLHRRAFWLALLLVALFFGGMGAVQANIKQKLTDEQFDQLAAATKAYQVGDYNAAVPLFRDLANQGIGEAQFYFGFLNAQGLGLPQDYAVAAEWYKKASRLGHAQAQNYLGLLYFQGDGVPRSFRDAFINFELAATAGNEDAANNRLIVARKMTSSQITEAQKAAGEIIRSLKFKVKRLIEPTRVTSAVAVAGGDVFLTHADAIDACPNMTVRFENDVPRDAALVMVDGFNGLAMIGAPGLSAEPLPLRVEPVAVGERVMVVGYILNEKSKPEIEVVEAQVIADPALHRMDKRYLQLAGTMGESHLGAAVVDREGRLVGIMDPTLNASAVAQLRGAPQQAAFALRHELIHLMFEFNGYHYESAATDEMAPPMPAEVVLDPVRAAAAAIECWEAPVTDEIRDDQAETGISPPQSG